MVIATHLGSPGCFFFALAAAALSSFPLVAAAMLQRRRRPGQFPALFSPEHVLSVRELEEVE
jgi:hypothetical protein